MGQNALGQSDCRIFKSAISLEQNDDKAYIFCMLIQICKNQKLTKKHMSARGRKWMWLFWSQYS